MKTKTKDIHNNLMKIGAAILALAVAAGASTPAITSFTQAQPVTKTKKKAKAKKKTKAKTTVLKTVTLTKGKSKTVSVKTKSKVKWTSSNAKVASVKSISKSKVKVTAKKEGSTKVSGKAGSAKWSFTVKVKKANPKPTGKSTKKKTNTAKKKTNASHGKANVRISGIENNETIEFNTPGETNQDIFITAESDNPKSIKFSTSNPSVTNIKPIYEEDCAYCTLQPYQAGEAIITVSYPGDSKSYKVNVNESKVYSIAKNFTTKVNSSGLDDAHKAFVTAKWLEKRVSYGIGDNISHGSLESAIIDGKGVCSDYAKTYEWLLNFENIKSRRINTGSIGDHEWNQICVNGKWYNVDVSNNDEEPFNPEGAECFMKSDNCSNDFFSDRRHAVKYRSGKGEYPVTATATDYDSYDWSSFAQSEQFKSLIS